jgi:hypothetical protein
MKSGIFELVAPPRRLLMVPFYARDPEPMKNGAVKWRSSSRATEQWIPAFAG